MNANIVYMTADNDELYCSSRCAPDGADPMPKDQIESDSIKSCASCHKFLKVNLTDYGKHDLIEFVVGNANDCDYPIIWMWCDHYGITDQVKARINAIYGDE